MEDQQVGGAGGVGLIRGQEDRRTFREIVEMMVPVITAYLITQVKGLCD